MKKLSLLAGTIGSTAAWYILSNKRLRTELGKAKTPEETVKILSHHLGRDASTIGKAVYEWIHSEELQDGLTKARTVAGEKLASAKRGIDGLLAKAKHAKDAAMKRQKEQRDRG